VVAVNGNPVITLLIPGLADADGHAVTVRARKGYDGYGSRPYSIVRRTRGGKRYMEAEWMPTGQRALFAGKRDAVRFIQAHECIAFGASADPQRQQELFGRVIFPPAG
jgi:hypothetical protein